MSLIYVIIAILILSLLMILQNIWYDESKTTSKKENEYFKALFPTPKIMTLACDSLGIPYSVPEKHKLIIGDGQIVFDRDHSNLNSYRSKHLSMNKNLCSKFLNKHNLPVPKFQSFPGLKSNADIEHIVQNLTLEYPLVVKPACGSSGVFVKVGISNENELKMVLREMINLKHRKIKCPEIMIEEYVEGYNYRFMFYQDILLDVIKREIPYVIGDGESTLGQLIHRWEEYRKEFDLYPMQVDWNHLKKSGIDQNTIIAKNKKFTVKQTCGCCVYNHIKMSKEDIHPSYLDKFSRINKLMGSNFCGIDVIASDLSKPGNAKINEVNSAPSMRCHYYRDLGYMNRKTDLEVPIKLLRLVFE